MKASMKFREDQIPLSRAKIPLTILGFPFQAGVVAGSPKELSLSLASFLEYGPSLKLAYRPNDGFNLFNLVFKTGIGRFGSPNLSPMTMSAEFNLTAGSHNPRFFVHFKPHFGDFSIKKSQSSDFVIKGSNDDSIAAAVVTPTKVAVGMICGLLRGMEGSARTSLPVMRRAMVDFRWGFRFPTDDLHRGVVRKLPLLVMNKISIVHVTKEENKNERANLSGGDDVVDMKRQLEIIQCDNAMMRKGLDELRYEFANGRFVDRVGVDMKLKGVGGKNQDLKIPMH